MRLFVSTELSGASPSFIKRSVIRNHDNVLIKTVTALFVTLESKRRFSSLDSKASECSNIFIFDSFYFRLFTFIVPVGCLRCERFQGNA